MNALVDFAAIGIGPSTLLMFGLMVALLLTGMPLAFVTLLVALVFALVGYGPLAVPLITSRIYTFVESFVFVTVPMFVLMAMAVLLIWFFPALVTWLPQQMKLG